jgi:hypothetical protein
MSDLTDQLDAIEARHGAWYGGDDTTAEWPDPLSFVEGYEHDKDSTPRKRAMAHEIVREDIPTLLELARKQQAALDAVRELASQWDARGAHDMLVSKTIPDDDIAAAVYTDGAQKVENARKIRNALEAKP